MILLRLTLLMIIAMTLMIIASKVRGVLENGKVWIFRETMSWPRRRNGKRDAEKNRRSAKTVKRQTTGNGRRPRRKGQPFI